MATKKSNAATIYDVAERAGVSHQTVSRFLAGYEGIRPLTREKVATALKELDYRPNLAARSLATNRAHRIAVLTGDLLAAGPSRTVQGVAEAARAAGYVVDIIGFDVDDPDSLKEVIDVIRSQDLAGVVALAVSDSIHDAIAGLAIDAPLYLDSGPADLPGPVGQSFNSVGIQLVLQHLIDLGHREIVHVTGAMDYLAAKARVNGFGHLIRERGLREHPVIEGDWTPRSGYAAVRSGLIDPAVTAIVAANDQIALGALRALDEAGVRCPVDVSVTGFDDIPEAEYYTPSLTTVRIDFQQQGTYIFNALMAQIRGDERPETGAFIKPELVVRASTAPPR
jgi:LacI family transcriptional regulator